MKQKEWELIEIESIDDSGGKKRTTTTTTSEDGRPTYQAREHCCKDANHRPDVLEQRLPRLTRDVLHDCVCEILPQEEQRPKEMYRQKLNDGVPAMIDNVHCPHDMANVRGDPERLPELPPCFCRIEVTLSVSTEGGKAEEVVFSHGCCLSLSFSFCFVRGVLFISRSTSWERRAMWDAFHSHFHPGGEYKRVETFISVPIRPFTINKVRTYAHPVWHFSSNPKASHIFSCNRKVKQKLFLSRQVLLWRNFESRLLYHNSIFSSWARRYVKYS